MSKGKRLKPLPKSARKGCIGCKLYEMYFCSLAGEKKKIPLDISRADKKCKARQKTKHIYF